MWLSNRSQHVSHSKRIHFTFSSYWGPNMLQTSLRNNPRKDVFQNARCRGPREMLLAGVDFIVGISPAWSDDGWEKAPLADKSPALSISILWGENSSRVIDCFRCTIAVFLEINLYRLWIFLLSDLGAEWKNTCNDFIDCLTVGIWNICLFIFRDLPC